MQDQPNVTLQTVAVAAELERVRAQKAKIADRISNAQLRLNKLKNLEISLQNQLHELQIRNDQVELPTTASISNKNIDYLRAWAALRAALITSNPSSLLAHHQCVRVLRTAVPGIGEATIRSHLHRLKKRGFIEKIGGGWRLATARLLSRSGDERSAEQ